MYLSTDLRLLVKTEGSSEIRESASSASSSLATFDFSSRCFLLARRQALPWLPNTLLPESSSWASPQANERLLPRCRPLPRLSPAMTRSSSESTLLDRLPLVVFLFASSARTLDKLESLAAMLSFLCLISPLSRGIE